MRGIARDLAARGLGTMKSCVVDPVLASFANPISVTIDDDTPVMAGLSLMTKRRIRHLPVVVGGELIGLISIGDLVKFRIDRIEAEAAALRDYIQTA